MYNRGSITKYLVYILVYQRVSFNPFYTPLSSVYLSDTFNPVYMYTRGLIFNIFYTLLGNVYLRVTFNLFYTLLGGV